MAQVTCWKSCYVFDKLYKRGNVYTLSPERLVELRETGVIKFFHKGGDEVDTAELEAKYQAEQRAHRRRAEETSQRNDARIRAEEQMLVEEEIKAKRRAAVEEKTQAAAEKRGSGQTRKDS